VFDHHPDLDDEYRRAFARTVTGLRARGVTVVEIDPTAFLTAARLLYDGALVAERYAAVGAFLDTAPAGADPVVSRIIRAARDIPAHRLVTDLAELDRLRRIAMSEIAGVDALLTPTAPGQPTIAEVAADPLGANARLGVYTNFCNLFDMCAVAVPAGRAGAGQFGVTVLAPAFHDAVALDIAARLCDEPPLDAWPTAAAPVEPLVVFGAHLRDGPLAHQLIDLGARWAGPVRTAPRYRIAVVPGHPPKPAVTRCADHQPGICVAGEQWLLSPAALGRFLSALPAPMQLGAVELADGSWRTGFACDPAAASAAHDISEYGGWRAALAAGAVPDPSAAVPSTRG
jgi:allophanate hydrolase